MTRVAVLISGRGSNMRSIVEACQTGAVDATVVAVISNNPDAAGLAFAREHNIDTAAIDHTSFANRIDFDRQLKTLVDSFEPDWVLLAGFMRILGSEFVSHFVGRMINIHPSLLPLHPGLNTHAKVLAAGQADNRAGRGTGSGQRYRENTGRACVTHRTQTVRTGIAALCDW